MKSVARFIKQRNSRWAKVRDAFDAEVIDQVRNKLRRESQGHNVAIGVAQNLETL